MWSDMKTPWLQGPLHTVYLGGGTPSLLSVAQAAQILETVYQAFVVTPDAEITMEVNPGTVDAAYLSAIRQLGINRLSIGAQSFDPSKLSFLSRIHTRDQVFETLSGAARAGFSNLGLDLMYALPNETSDVWQTDLDTALALQLPHLSCYMLTLEPGTPFYGQYKKGYFSPCDPDRRSDFFVHTARVLENAGYSHYEVSNFAKTRPYRSNHNTHYWERRAYLGVGPSAHSFFPRISGTGQAPGTDRALLSLRHFTDTGGPARFWNPRDFYAWQDAVTARDMPGSGHEILTPSQERMEQVMLGLRTDNGICLKPFGPDFHNLLNSLAARGLGHFFYSNPTDSPGIQRFRLTRSGMVCLDSIVDALVRKIL
jgi:oxygen-independent coproporphyrinogen-3 oxidase